MALSFMSAVAIMAHVWTRGERVLLRHGFDSKCVVDASFELGKSRAKGPARTLLA